MRTTLRTLIVDGLGYCCPWAFFSIFRKTGEIATRLGVADFSVRRYKRAVKEGKMKCEGCPRCMRAAVKAVQVIGKKDLGL